MKGLKLVSILSLCLFAAGTMLAACGEVKPATTGTPTSGKTEAPAAAPTAGTAGTSAAGQTGMPPAEPQAVYTCPMHAEVTADKPGKCPKCGMDLVKK